MGEDGLGTVIDTRHMAAPGRPLRYRMTLDGPVPAGLTAAFPALVTGRDDRGRSVVEGEVVDAAQLAGIVCEICYRNAMIVRLEELGGLGAKTTP